MKHLDAPVPADVGEPLLAADDRAPGEAPAPLDQLITPWARRTPHQVAVTGADGDTTYAELDRSSNRVARALLGAGLRAGDRVGLCLPRSARAIAAMLGTLRAGGVYVPIDHRAPPAWVFRIIRDCGLRHLVLTTEWVRRLESEQPLPGDTHYFVADALGRPTANEPRRVHGWGDVQATESEAVPPDGRGPDDFAYLLYTSGSTGTPKGVMLSHRNALTFMTWAVAHLGLGPGDRVASITPFHFALSLFHVYATAMAGATLVLLDEALTTVPARLVQQAREAEVTVWYSVPSVPVLMLDRGGLEVSGLPSLRAVLFAGEPFPVPYLRRMMAAVPRARYFNFLGTTETHVCLVEEVTWPPGADDRAAPLGRPCAGARVWVLGPDGRPVPPGEVGELHVDCPGLMLGYWRPDQPVPPLRPHPTGDLVSLRSDGRLMHHGRRDDMVKIHGQRVELGEVEATLQTHARVRSAVVLAVGQTLVAVVVPADPELSVLDLKRHCASLLPGCMVPGEVWLVDELPRTSTGKADRVRLRTLAVEEQLATLRPAASR